MKRLKQAGIIALAAVALTTAAFYRGTELILSNTLH